MVCIEKIDVWVFGLVGLEWGLAAKQKDENISQIGLDENTFTGVLLAIVGGLFRVALFQSRTNMNIDQWLRRNVLFRGV